MTDPALRRFRYGVQVNSLGLTEQQPENNVPRIVLEMLGVTLSRDARARAIQLPCWNEALGLPRPWDQQWSLRMQQILAYETDLLEYEDLFEGSKVVERKSPKLETEAQGRARLGSRRCGGSFAAIDRDGSRAVSSRRIPNGLRSGRGEGRRRREPIHRDRSRLRSRWTAGILRVDPRRRA